MISPAIPQVRNAGARTHRIAKCHSAQQHAELSHAPSLLVNAPAAGLLAAALTAAVVVGFAEGVAEVEHTALCPQGALVQPTKDK